MQRSHKKIDAVASRGQATVDTWVILEPKGGGARTESPDLDKSSRV